MAGHTKSGTNLLDRTSQFGAAVGDDGIVRCDACPVLCRIKPGRSGACDRYANEDGKLIRCESLYVTQRTLADHSDADTSEKTEQMFVTGIGAGTTYPDYKPAPFIVSSEIDGVDTVTVVTEGIFSFCGLKLKIDTDRHLGDECSPVRHKGEQVGHVTTTEYGSQMLSLGGVRHLTGGERKEGRLTCEALLALCNKEAVELEIDDGAKIEVQAGRAPIVNGVVEQRMRVGCGSAVVGIFAQQWFGLVDEVIVVDDHITGQLSPHQAGVCLDMRPTGIRLKGRKSTPGRYFNVAHPGSGWGGTDIQNPLDIIDRIDPKLAWPGMRVLFTSTTGEHSLYYTLNSDFELIAEDTPSEVQTVVDRLGENCEASMTTVLFMAGAGGSLRAGFTTNPIQLTRAVVDGQVQVSMGGVPVYRYPGGGITIMVDVLDLPENAFGYVPTPALVAPLEFELPMALYEDCGGHVEQAVRAQEVIDQLGEDLRADSPFKVVSSNG